MNLAIQNLINLGAITECQQTNDQFLSKIFLTPKSNGGYRFILNLKGLNKFVAKSHFKMEDFRTASKLIPKNGFMATIDLKEAYLLVPIATNHRKYLRFEYNNVTYEFCSLVYGLSVAPRTFTKIMKEVVTYLRKRGLTSTIYLDDILCIGRDLNECKYNVRETLRLLECLGFVVNYTKSSIQPQQCCKFLGFVYNSIDMSISLPMEKRNYIAQLLAKFIQLPVCTIREYAHLLGVLTAACPAARYSWLYTKLLERYKFRAIQEYDDYDQKVKLPREILPDLFWWTNNIYVTSCHLGITKFDAEIFTDASRSGWGAVCDGVCANGAWKEQELAFHINYLELLAVFLGLKCFARNKSNCALLLRIDNTTAISYINRMGGIQFPHLNSLTRSIWQWCEERDIWLFASYINTKDNVEADRESRRLNPDIEWNLSIAAFERIRVHFGVPEIDLFASRTSAKCEIYISWKPDPDALTVDAFTISWYNKYFYAFPPFTLVLKCLHKIINDNATGIVVFPYWPSQPWFPLLLRLVISDIIYFDPKSHIDQFRCSRTRDLKFNQFTLAAAKLSGERFQAEGFQRLH
jgi:hypothetical protein